MRFTAKDFKEINFLTETTLIHSLSGAISKYDVFPASILFGFCITMLYPVLIHINGRERN